ncbi:MAG: NADH-quinone oxidoreductase subunit C [bacterium]|nr:NADH-quinone oxidoreductase subunit C [bacterium]
MNTTELFDHLSEKLKAQFGDDFIGGEIQYDFPVFIVEKKSILEVLQYLKTTPELNYHFLTTLCGIHMPENKGAELAIMYQLHNMVDNHRIRVKIFMEDGDVKVPSATSIWPTANWMERQEYDFFGFNFIGHPDLRRILNMDEMNYFPMRKEYPLEDGSRDDKSDKMFGR